MLEIKENNRISDLVFVEITAPGFWWQDFEACKTGLEIIETNREPIIYNIHKKPFELDDFSLEGSYFYVSTMNLIQILNDIRSNYLQTGDDKMYRSIIELLPQSYNQKRTIVFNIKALKGLFHIKDNNELNEWQTFCEWVKTLIT